LHDANIAVRRAAAEVIGRFGEMGSSHVSSIIILLEDPEVTVQRTATESLGMLGFAGARHVSRVLQLLDNKKTDSTVRCAAIKALCSLARFCGADPLAERPESALDSAAPHPERPESALGVSLASDMGKKSRIAKEDDEVTAATITAKIVELLHDDEPNVRASAADALAWMVAEGLTTNPDDEDMHMHEVHVEAVGALLTDGAPGVRRAAIEALGIMAPPGPWLDDVQWLLQDSHPGVRRAAECVFNRLQREELHAGEEEANGDMQDEEDYDGQELEDSEFSQQDGSEFEGYNDENLIV